MGLGGPSPFCRKQFSFCTAFYCSVQVRTRHAAVATSLSQCLGEAVAMQAIAHTPAVLQLNPAGLPAALRGWEAVLGPAAAAKLVLQDAMVLQCDAGAVALGAAALEAGGFAPEVAQAVVAGAPVLVDFASEDLMAAAKALVGEQDVDPAQVVAQACAHELASRLVQLEEQAAVRAQLLQDEKAERLQVPSSLSTPPHGGAAGPGPCMRHPPAPLPPPRVLKDSGAGSATNKCP